MSRFGLGVAIGVLFFANVYDSEFLLLLMSVISFALGSLSALSRLVVREGERGAVAERGCVACAGSGRGVRVVVEEVEEGTGRGEECVEVVGGWEWGAVAMTRVAEGEVGRDGLRVGDGMGLDMMSWAVATSV